MNKIKRIAIPALRVQERSRASREIHDELCQKLTGLKKDLHGLESRLDQIGAEHLRTALRDKIISVGDLADEIMAPVQRISGKLRLAMLNRVDGTDQIESKPTPDGPKSLCVLVADDHDIIHHGLKWLLTDHFRAVTLGEAKNTQETLDHCALQPWDVILLDINMAGRNGPDILADLKQVCPKSPVLIMSACPETDFAVCALKSGAAGFLNKRTLGAEIVPAIKRVLRGERYVSAALAGKLAEYIGGSTLPGHEALSQREFQVLRLIALGKTIKEIGSELSLSAKTVSTYRMRISGKLRLGSNVQLTRYAIRHRLVD